MFFLILLDSLTLAIFPPNIEASMFSVTGSSFYPIPKAISPSSPESSILPFRLAAQSAWSSPWSDLFARMSRHFTFWGSCLSNMIGLSEAAK